jgi:hypothetical protein
MPTCKFQSQAFANQLFKKLNVQHKQTLLSFIEKDLDKNLFNMKKRLKKNQ